MLRSTFVFILFFFFFFFFFFLYVLFGSPNSFLKWVKWSINVLCSIVIPRTSLITTRHLFSASIDSLAYKVGQLLTARNDQIFNGVNYGVEDIVETVKVLSWRWTLPRFASSMNGVGILSIVLGGQQGGRCGRAWWVRPISFVMAVTATC
ncbi:hypothetical protein MtrunA17_Chr2g0277691 [Medicago truncatula]|uniref:Transmembrane protein n=1 Tax=Medicago truncatula TaxID=3880 RepID=A0A396J451_MEDTR|nr:hypothetical protein MtrunA17_Chr2g0277691 [Medicago truncatula]